MFRSAFDLAAGVRSNRIAFHSTTESSGLMAMAHRVSRCSAERLLTRSTTGWSRPKLAVGDFLSDGLQYFVSRPSLKSSTKRNSVQAVIARTSTSDVSKIAAGWPLSKMRPCANDPEQSSSITKKQTLNISVQPRLITANRTQSSSSLRQYCVTICWMVLFNRSRIAANSTGC
jgi:hypothetical protein